MIKNFKENETLYKLISVLTMGEFEEPEPENPAFMKCFVTGMFEKMDFAEEFLEFHILELRTTIRDIPDTRRSAH
jgi:hypothetical protein